MQGLEPRSVEALRVGPNGEKHFVMHVIAGSRELCTGPK